MSGDPSSESVPGGHHAQRLVRFGHSPDPDDAFMFYGLAKGLVTVPGCRIEHVIQDIQSLNQRARDQADLEVSAISAAVYPQLAARYRIMSAGASIGRGYGPVLVTKVLEDPSKLASARIAIPGEQTTAFLLLRLFLASANRSARFQPLQFDRIPDAVLSGEVDAGLVIHEAQLTHPDLGLKALVDLGQWWAEQTGLPIPLGLDVVRRDLGEGLSLALDDGLRRSIQAAYANEAAALDYALSFGRGIGRDTCRDFVRLYVNQDTLDIGQEGEQALRTLFVRARAAGLIDVVPPLDVVRAAQ